MFNTAFHYHNDQLYCEALSVESIVETVGTPVYLYSLKRMVENYTVIRDAFAAAGIDAHIHYSAKANANLTILGTLIEAGAGIDAVSGGEIYRAIAAGCRGDDIVFAGVGKSTAELAYALDQKVGWFNVENVAECDRLNALAAQRGVIARVSLRLNPNVAAKTHPHIATGHGGAKFGLSADVVDDLLSHRAKYSHVRFEGIHIHIGSQLHDVHETAQAAQIAVDVVKPYPFVTTLDIGGGFPVLYADDDELPPISAFAEALKPVVGGYRVLLEPGRSIVADAGILVTRVEYIKHQDEQTFVICDAGMTELIRPMLYEAHHAIVPVRRKSGDALIAQVVGPVCESTDVLARNVHMSGVEAGDLLAIMTTGAYGMVMAGNYNARPRPAEVGVGVDGRSWSIIRRRETWADLVVLEDLNL